MLIGHASTTDPRHARSVEIINDLGRGVYGRAFLTDYVLAEVLNYAVARSRNPRVPEEIARDLLGENGEPWLDFVRIDDNTWRAARERFRVLSLAGLSFTDCTSIAFVERHRLDAVLSFDTGFDRAVPRVG